VADQQYNIIQINKNIRQSEKLLKIVFIKKNTIYYLSLKIIDVDVNKK